MNPINERKVVIDILLRMEEKQEYLHLALQRELKEYKELDSRQRAFITRVVNGTLERRIQLDYVINQFSKTKVKKMKPVIREIIRSAVYQLLYMDSVPDSATCNEAVKLTGKRGMQGLKGFVNGVLRNIARKKDEISWPEKTDIVNWLSVRYSMPEWIVRQWMKVYGEQTAEIMMEGVLQKKKVTVRTRILNSTGVSRLRENLKVAGVETHIHPYLPYALVLEQVDNLEQLEAFQTGAFYIQDVSSMLVGELAPVKPEDRVVDLCAAPGGKSLHLAEKLTSTGLVEARDLTDYKVNLMRENIARLGYTNIQAVKKDALLFDETWNERADIVLADLPCSGLGIIGKKPDLKYRVTEADEHSLEALQRKILVNAVQYVRPGGTLIYSTCTVNRGENADQVHWLLGEYSAFELVDIRPLLCEELAKDVEELGMLQLLPGVHACDGFFLAVLRRKEHH